MFTNKLDLISKADHFVLPGVGSFPDCKKGLDDIEGLVELLGIISSIISLRSFYRPK